MEGALIGPSGVPLTVMHTSNSASLRTEFVPRTVPETLSSAEAKLVYLYLTGVGGSTVEDLHRALGMKKLSLFPVLDTLDERGLVDRDGDRYLVSSRSS